MAFRVHLLPLFLPAAFLFACIGDCGDPPPFHMPAQPIHLKELSSPYDDWNCGEPDSIPGAESRPFLFSSNRASAGGQFDLIQSKFILEGGDSVKVQDFRPVPWLARLADSVNTGEDELGPSFWSPPIVREYRGPAALVFSRGSRADHDLWVLLPADGELEGYIDTALLPQRPLAPLNTGADEGYATWHAGWNRILFHSNRGGRYRIYQAEIPMDADGPFAWLANPASAGVKVSEVPGLSAADGEERCPFLRGNTLYFVSDRSGGQGGFDVYRSEYRSGAWSEPANLGPAVNSSADEYRPHPIDMYDTDPALLYSSNRPGGLGGYDLYLAKLNP